MQQLIYRMEDGHHHGPFNATLAKRDLEGVINAWSHVSWADVSFFGLSALDDTHPHHIPDVLGLDAEAAYRAEYLDQLPIAGKWLVGCRDVPQFLHWFPKEALPFFAREDLQLSVYDCDPEAVKLGTYQVMFDPKRAQLIRREALTCPELMAA